MKWTLCIGCATLAAAAPARSSQSQIPITEPDAGSERSGIYSIPLATPNNIIHTLNFTIGTPPQHFNASLDLYSNAFFVPSIQSHTDGYKKRKYNSTSSTSYLPHGAPAKVDYWDVVYEGFLSGDTVQIGSIKTPAQIFEEYTASHKRWWFAVQSDFDGVLGLAPPWNADQTDQNYPNYLALLQSQHTLTSDVFSLKLPRSITEPGELTFGGSNPILYTGEFHNISVVPDPLLDPEWRGNWVLPLSSLSINTEPAIHHPTPNYTVILSSTPYLALPAAFVASLSTAINIPLNGMLGTPIPCDRRSSLPEIEFEFGGTGFAVDGWDYVFEVPFGEEGEVVCVVWIVEAEDWGVREDAVVVGTAFLRGWYTRWEFGEERKVGFAKLKL